jgi:hypothetical protein
LASETEAHSDDELALGPTVASDHDAGQDVYHITEKDGRAAKVKNLFRLADTQRRRMAKSKRKAQKYVNFSLSQLSD